MGSSSKVDNLSSTLKDVRDEMVKTIDKLVYLAGIVRESNSSFEDSNLFVQAGAFKDLVDTLKVRDFTRNGEIKSLGQSILCLEKPMKGDVTVTKEEFENNITKIQKLFEMFSINNIALKKKFDILKFELERVASKKIHPVADKGTTWDDLITDQAKTRIRLLPMQ